MQPIKESSAAFLEKVQCNNTVINSSDKDKPTRKNVKKNLEYFLVPLLIRRSYVYVKNRLGYQPNLVYQKQL